MKRLVAVFMALMLMLGLSVGALADAADELVDGYTDMTQVTVTKVYKLVGAGSSPAETFTLAQVGDGEVTNGEAQSAPALGIITGAAFEAGAATAEGAEGTITIQLPTYNTVGEYEYTLQEVAGTTAGVTYYGGTIRLVVTVINDSEGNIRVAAVHTEEVSSSTKSDKFTNTYSAGTLNVTKTVTGNLGDKNKYFDFTVTLTGVTGKNYAETYAVTGGSDQTNPASIKIGEATTFHLKHDETISIANLPYGVSYTVEEADASADGYITTKTGDTGTINSADQTAAFTNNKDTTVDTGITTDSMPYIVLLGMVALAGVAMLIKRHGYNN